LLVQVLQVQAYRVRKVLVDSKELQVIRVSKVFKVSETKVRRVFKVYKVT
jgi:hypothetical protein